VCDLKCINNRAKNRKENGGNKRANEGRWKWASIRVTLKFNKSEFMPPDASEQEILSRTQACVCVCVGLKPLSA